MNNPSVSKIISIVTNRSPYPAFSGEKQRILAMMMALRERGHTIILVILSGDSISSDVLKELGKYADFIEYVYCNATFLRKIKYSFKRFFSKVVFSLGRNRNILSFYNKIKLFINIKNLKFHEQNAIPVDFVKNMYLKHMPNIIIAVGIETVNVFKYAPQKCLKILDTQDARSAVDWGIQGLKSHKYISVEEERRELMKADVVLAIQDNEANYFKTFIPNKKIITVSHYIPIEKSYSKQTSLSVLFVGGGNSPNSHGLNNFLNHAWPHVLHQIPDAELLIIGKVQVYPDSFSKNCKILGPVKNIEYYYKIARVAINPVSYGSGIKIKTLEALCYGIPLVTTSHGVSGINPDVNKVCMVNDNWIDFSENIITFLTNQDLRLNYAKESLCFAQTHLNKQRIYSTLFETIESYSF